MLQSVSTLFTTVGWPYSPLIAGNGGLRRGWPRSPSSESMSAVSSPQMYAPAPPCTITSQSNPLPRMFVPMYPAGARLFDRALEEQSLIVVLTADVDERGVDLQRIRRDEQTLR